jgi:hypothetical protein
MVGDDLVPVIAAHGHGVFNERVRARHAEASLRHLPLRARQIVPASAAALNATVEALAFFGEKRVGTAAGARAGAYILDRLRGAGLNGARFEEFSFPRHDVLGATLEMRTPGQGWVTLGFDAFEGSGDGGAEADVVAVGTATPEELAGLDLRGRVALVERHRFYHRSTQYRNLAAAGALAMIDVSAAPDNRRQVGSVRRAFEAMGSIPAVTVGADDGERLLDAARAGRLAARLSVAARVAPATGANVVAEIPGTRPELGAIVIGAHYDTWFTGSTDNGAGVAALLALAELWASRPAPTATLVFVAWDGEEIALYGGYDWLRRHIVAGGERVLAVLDLETPSALGGLFYGLARSGCPCLDHALRAGELDRVYTGYLPMSVVPRIFGGIIPTDVQGFYRSGVRTASTAVDSPYYHTDADTPDKVDYPHLARAVAGFDRAIATLAASAAEGALDVAEPGDEELWRAAAVVEGDGVLVEVRDRHGQPCVGARVDATLLVDDFFVTGEAAGRTDDRGRARLALPVARAHGWLHVSAGHEYPLVERVLAVTG